jgi:hypothetical protein
MTPADEIREQLAEANPDALLADGLEQALIGYTINTHHAPRPCGRLLREEVRRVPGVQHLLLLRRAEWAAFHWG